MDVIRVEFVEFCVDAWSRVVELSGGRKRGGRLVFRKMKPKEVVDGVDPTDPLCVVGVGWVEILVVEFCDSVNPGNVGKGVEPIIIGRSSLGCVEVVA